MVHEWRKCRWGDLVSLEYGKGIRGYENTDGPYLVFGTNGPIGRHSVPLCNHPGVIIGRKGAYRGIHYSNKPFYVIDTAFYLEPKEDIDLKWAYYELLTHDINSMDSGSAIPSTSRDAFYSLPVKVPPLQVQHSIARVLGSLDDKIKLNHQMNETLESIARAIFKSWFIDFDPVRYKMQGCKPYGMDNEAAALFPSSFENSELGQTPSGWHVDKFSTMIELIGGGTPKTSIPEYWNGTIPWFSVVDTPNEGSVFVINTERKITEEGLNNSSTRILTPGTTIITARGTVGKCALVGSPMAMNQSCYGVTGKEGRGNYFIYIALRKLVSSLQQSSHGTVFDTITRDTFETIKVVCPPITLTQHFDKQVSIYLDQILLNLHQSQTLTTIRDTLLPKLLSGEIRVKDAEKYAEAHL